MGSRNIKGDIIQYATSKDMLSYSNKSLSLDGGLMSLLF